MTPIEGKATLYLIGFRIEPDIFDPQMYTIYINDDRPIMLKGQPILFPRAELATVALANSDCSASLVGPAPTELYAVFDIAEAIYTLNEKDEEGSNEILNLLNVILDFVKCVQITMPLNFHAILTTLADHLTFNKRLPEFFDQHGLTRQMVTDAIFWSIGMILYNAKIIAS